MVIVESRKKMIPFSNISSIFDNSLVSKRKTHIKKKEEKEVISSGIFE